MLQPAEDHPAVVELQKQLMVAVAETPEVQRLAEEAFRSFTRAYAAHPSSVKDVFHVKKLHLGHVAHSFALRWASHQYKSVSSWECVVVLLVIMQFPRD